MARIRSIKPEFWRDEDLARISAEAALLAIGLLNHADDEGYFNANPKLVESDVFPLRELSGSTTELMKELSDIGYIKLFSGSDGKRYGLIVNFEKHQVINKKTPSKIKELILVEEHYGSPTVVLPVGKERKGKEQGKEQGEEETPTPPPRKIKDEKFVPKTWLTSRGVPIDIVEDWLKIRIAKKLVHTERAFEAVAKEAAQANMSLPDAIEYCVKKSWGGFEAQWVENDRSRSGNGGNGPPRMTHTQAATLAAARTIFGDERKLTNGQRNIIDVTPAPVAGFLDSEDI